MAHKFKKGQLVSYRLKTKDGQIQIGFGNIQGRRGRFYLIKIKAQEEPMRVYSNKVREIKVPKNSTVVETKECNNTQSPIPRFDMYEIVGRINYLAQTAYKLYYVQLVAMVVIATIVIWALR